MKGLFFGVAAAVWSILTFANAQSGLAVGQIPPQILPIPALSNNSTTAVQFGQLDSSGDLSPLFNTRPFVWNANGPEGGVAMSSYIECCRDPVTITAGHTYAWYLSNHPDWLMYASRSPNATTTLSNACTTSCTSLKVLDLDGISVGNAVTSSSSGLSNLTFVTAVDNVNNTVTVAPATGSVGTSQSIYFWWGLLEFLPNDLNFVLNVQSPAVRQYLLASLVANGFQKGLNYAAIDNVGPSNGTKSYPQVPPETGSIPEGPIVGYYACPISGCGAPGSACASGSPPVCGGTWTPLYSGVEEDPAYFEAQLAYLQWLHANVNATGFGLAANVKVDKLYAQESIQLGLSTDLDLVEGPFLDGCDTNSNTIFEDQSDGQWAANIQAMTTVAVLQPEYQLGYLCGTSANPSGPLHDGPPTITLPEIDWDLGNYLLTRGAQTLMSTNNVNLKAGTQDYADFITYPTAAPTDMTPSVGYPTETTPSTVGAPATAPPAGGPCYERTYSTGLVEVWPYPSSSCNYNVPAGTWINGVAGGSAIPPGTYTLSPDTSIAGLPRANAIILVQTSP
jgi:hypothetical protein